MAEVQNRHTLNHKFSVQQNVCFHRAVFALEPCKRSFSQRERKVIGRKWCRFWSSL